MRAQPNPTFTRADGWQVPLAQASGSVFESDSTPLLCPLRYPGGKRWLVPAAKEYFEERRPSILIETCAGGATVGLSLLAANACDRLILVEKDPRVAAFWRTALGTDSLARRAAKFEPITEGIRAFLGRTPRNDADWAFWVYLKNRTSFGGNLDGGLQTKGNWRWKKIPSDLYQIRALASRITFIEGCGIEVLKAHDDVNNGAFCDPPYVEKGKLLYREHEFNHEELLHTLAVWRGNWLATYDDCPEIRSLASAHGMNCTLAPMRDNRHRSRFELLITKRQ